MHTSETLWQSPLEHIVLGSDEVQVWRAMLDMPISRVQALEQTLVSDERTRAKQFHFSKDRTHFIVTRGILRAILGLYLARNPRTLQFCYSECGKPLLAWEPGSDALMFNVTHSHGMALYAVTRNRDIGIDLERISGDVAYQQIAERFFSPYEVSMLRTVPAEMQREAFFRCWTRKEAYLKAKGSGLSLDLIQFAVSVTPGVPASILNTKEEEDQNISCWSLYDLSPDPGYVAALAVEGIPHHLRCWQWPEV